MIYPLDWPTGINNVLCLDTSYIYVNAMDVGGLVIYSTSGPFYWRGSTLIPAWTSNYIHYNVWDEIIHPFPNFNGCTVDIWELISNYIPHFTGYVITFPCWD